MDESEQIDFVPTGPCNGNETAVTTDVKCVIDAQTMEGSCLGPGDTLVPQEARAFQALSALPSTRTDGCFYNFPDANTVTARSPSATECYARITSCVAGKKSFTFGYFFIAK